MNNKGMTVIELITGLLIFAVIAMSVTTVLSSTAGAYLKANELAETNMLFNSLSNELLNDLSSASKVEVAGGELIITTNAADIDYNIVNGVLYRNGRAVLDEGFYKRKALTFAFYRADDADKTSPLSDTELPSAFIVRLTLSYAGGVVSRDYAAKPLGLSM